MGSGGFLRRFRRARYKRGRLLPEWLVTGILVVCAVGVLVLAAWSISSS